MTTEPKDVRAVVRETLHRKCNERILSLEKKLAAMTEVVEAARELDEYHSENCRFALNKGRRSCDCGKDEVQGALSNLDNLEREYG